MVRRGFPRAALLALLALAFLAACTGPRRCDDGGSGGVVIDGVCL